MPLFLPHNLQTHLPARSVHSVLIVVCAALLAAGKFSGRIETMDEAIKFPISTEKKGEME
jgi:hypothetical protein